MRSLVLLLFASIHALADAALPKESPAASTLASVSLKGPYAAIEDYVKELQGAGSFLGERLVAGPRTEHATVFTLMQEPRGDRSSSFVAIRAETGWFIVSGDLYDPSREKGRWVLHWADANPYSEYLVMDLAEYAGWLVLRTVDAPLFRQFGKDGGHDKAAYYCTGQEHLCRLKPGDRPVCAAPIPVAGKAYCRPPRRRRGWDRPVPEAWRDWSRWDWHRPVALSRDGTITIPRAPRPRVTRLLRHLGSDFEAELVAPAGIHRLAATH